LTGTQPPPRPTGPAGDGSGTTVFAIKKLYLGDTDRMDNPSSDAWGTYGYNLDNVVTTCSGNDCVGIDQCKLVAGADPATAEDGPGGVDNAFGHKITPVIGQLGATAAINGDLAQGKFTIMFAIDKLGSGTAYSPLIGRLYAGGDLMHAPAFDGSDHWPVLAELLAGDMTDINKSQVNFTSAYVSGNTWVSGDPTTISLSLNVQGSTLTLNIAHAVVSFLMSSDHRTATNGVVAGVLKTEDLVSEIQMLVPQIANSQAFCDPNNTTVASVLDDIRKASDIMSEGTAGTSSEECDGISIGLGFDADIVQLGSIIPVPAPSPPFCMTAGG
jgi:hypothetical protein